MSNNYYLNLLHKKTLELEQLLKEFKESDFSEEYKKYVIGGYIVTLSSILEIGIGGLHSEKLDDLTSLIYYTRQKVVHYGYFNGLKHIEDIAQNIITTTKNTFSEEQDFYNKLFDIGNIYDVDNIVIKWSPDISNHSFFYNFKSKNGNQVLCIPTKKIFSLTKKSSEKVLEYVIDTSNPAALYTYSGKEAESFKELNSDEIKEFFRENYQVSAENYNEHLITMNAIINSFLTDPINSIQILEYASDEQFCKNTVDIIQDFIFNKTMYQSYIHNNTLIKDKYSLNKMQKTDYDKVSSDFKKNIAKYINEKDVFFIDITLKRGEYLFDILSTSDEKKANPEALCTALVQLFESGPKHFSNKFISSSPEFKKCYSNLLRYRQIFSHYILLGKEYNDTLERFKNEFLGLLKILEKANLSHIQFPIVGETSKYLTLERNKHEFFNYKHEQYLRIAKETYVGKKIYYSSHNPNSESLIAIFPGGNNISNTLYYKRDQSENLQPLYKIDEKTNKKSSINAANRPLNNATEVKADLSLSYLFTAYYHLKSFSNNTDRITINFHSSKANGNYAHKDKLSMVILRYYNQGYIPIELLQDVKLDTSTLSKGFINILDKKGNVVASVINEKKCTFKHNYNTDSVDYFSRIDNIDHNFSKRRHAK